MTDDRERSREIQPSNHTGHFSSRTCLVPLGRGVGAWRLIELPGSRTFPGGVSRSENFGLREFKSKNRSSEPIGNA